MHQLPMQRNSHCHPEEPQCTQDSYVWLVGLTWDHSQSCLSRAAAGQDSLGNPKWHQEFNTQLLPRFHTAESCFVHRPEVLSHLQATGNTNTGRCTVFRTKSPRTSCCISINWQKIEGVNMQQKRHGKLRVWRKKLPSSSVHWLQCPVLDNHIKYFFNTVLVMKKVLLLGGH